MATKKTKGGGGALSRSVGVSIRLDPKLRYLAELAARSHRRTLSSFIEWAVQQSLSSVVLRNEGKDVRLVDAADSLWDVDEADRFVKLVHHSYDLLIHEEQVLWKLISENGFLWKGSYSGSSHLDGFATFEWEPSLDNLIVKRLRRHFATFKSVAEGELSDSALPNWNSLSDPTPGKGDLVAAELEPKPK
jgi:hypothetical protein